MFYRKPERRVHLILIMMFPKEKATSPSSGQPEL